MSTMPVAANLALRLSIAGFLAEVLVWPNDPRFAGKAIAVRNLVVVGGFSLVFPALHAIGKRWRRGPGARWPRYPWWLDNLYLSIFWLDMAGNSFDLYDRYVNFDLVPHFHGTGALGAVLQGAFELSPLGSLGLANGIHGLLEAQESATDVLFGTHNVRGWWDTAGDLAAGLLGTALYTAGFRSVATQHTARR